MRFQLKNSRKIDDEAGGVGTRDSQEVRWDDMLIMQTLYRRRRLSSARPGTRSFERHLAPQDLDEHPSRLRPADVVVSLRVVEEAQAHRREVWIGTSMPSGGRHRSHGRKPVGDLLGRPVADEVLLPLVDGQEREMHEECMARLTDGRANVLSPQELVGLPAGAVHGRFEGDPSSRIMDGLILHLQRRAVGQAA